MIGMVTLDAVKVSIEHSEPCRCRVLDGAIYIALPCRRIGSHVTKRRVAQLIHSLKRKS